VLDYLKHYPEVNVNCWFLDRIVNLVDEGADVAIRIGELPSSSLQAIRVGNVRRVMCAAPSYLVQHGMPKSPEALTDHTTILASSVSPSPEWRFNDAGRQFAVPTLPRLITTTNDSAIVAAIAGLGITTLLSYQIAPEIEAGLLMIVLAEYEPSALPVHVVHREGKHVNQKVRAFLDLTIDKLRAEPSLRQKLKRRGALSTRSASHAKDRPSGYRLIPGSSDRQLRVPHTSAYFVLQTEFRIQVPSTFKRRQIIISANMLSADKDLRHSRATGPPRKRDRRVRVTIDTDFVEANPLPIQQRLRGKTGGATRFCIDLHCCHIHPNMLSTT
jgi:LysR substrate binding domain